MATWDPIDPADVVDLQFDFSVAPSTDGSKSFIPAGVGIASHTVTAPTTPPGLVIVSSSLAGKKVYFRTGPSPEEDYWVHFHLMLDNGEQRDTDAPTGAAAARTMTAAGHDWRMVFATRADERMALMMCCQRCGEFDEMYGSDTAQSDQIWELLVRNG